MYEQTMRVEQGQKDHKDHKRITETEYLSNAPRKPAKILKIDPRPPEHRDAMGQEPVNKFVTDLQTLEKATVWQTLVHMQYEDYELSSDELGLLKMKSAQSEDSFKVPGKW